MLLARPKDFEKVKEIFYKHKKWFPHIRTDYMKRMIAKERMVYEDSVIITFHHAKRKQKIGDVQLQKGDTVLHQIASEYQGDGNGRSIINRFFKWCPQDVFLSLRADNLTACKFYDSIGMKVEGKTSWAKGTLPGLVYGKRKTSS